MATKLRTQEVAALRRALDSERYATKVAQEKSAELQKALESERVALRVLRRDIAGQIKAAREEECNKYTGVIEQLKTRMALGQSEAVEMQKESTARAVAAEFQREMHAREEELKKEARKQILLLQEQLREALKSQQQDIAQSEKDALIHSLHAEYQRTLHSKQEDWKRETKLQVEIVTSQLREAQRQCQELMAKLAATTNDAEQTHKLRQDVNALKMQNKELDEKVQVLTEADRRKVEEFRSQYEDFEARLNEMQKSARKEAHQLLEEMKSKDRHISELERELHLLATRLNVQRQLQTSFRSASRSRLNSDSSSRLRLDAERPGEPPRLCMKRPKNPLFVSELAKRVRGGEARPKPSDRNISTKDIHTIVQTHDTMEQESTSKSTEPRTIPTLNTNRQLKTCTSEGTTTEDLINNSWTKVVGLDTLYKLLCEEHQELQRTYQTVCTKLREEERARVKLEDQFRDWKRAESENAINLAMAEQIQALQDRQTELEAEAQDLREQNDLLEFRILELDDGMCSNSGSLHAKSPSSRSPDTRDGAELDDVSDSGVMSLTTSEDISEADFQDYKVEPNNRDVKSRLSHMCQNVDNVNDQICLQQTLTLLRHYESRLESLEATLAAMCQEATMSRSNSILSDTSAPLNSDTSKSPSRIIATVLPFTDLSPNYEKDTQVEYPIKKLLKDVDCLQESGIFEGSSDLVTQGTQTDWTADKFSSPPGDLGAEIRKLTQIRERIEEQGGNKKLLKVPGSGDDEINTHATLKELLFYRERLDILENKVAIYESRGDEQSKLLATRLEREVLLAAQVEFLKSTVQRLHEENRQLEEEKCEYEEAENDTRLRCQKLEVKLSALGEKKSDLQVQLQQNARTMSNLRSTLSEEERKKIEAKQRLARLENALSRLEQQNFELEEREMEVRCKLQVLEVTLPALMVWFLWKMLNSVRPYVKTTITGTTIALKEIADTPTGYSTEVEISGKDKRNHLKDRLRMLELQLEMESSQLYQSRNSEQALKYRLEELEGILKMKDNLQIEKDVKLNLETVTKAKELEKKCNELENKIKEYETREEQYTSTIQDVDQFWAKEKAELKDIIENLEERLMNKDKELDRFGTHAKKLSISQEVETELQEHIQQLHQEMSELKEKLIQREKENKAKVEDEKRLWKDLNDAVEQIDYFKTNIEVALKEEIKQLKKKNKYLGQQLDTTSQAEQEDRDSQMATIKELRTSLRQKSKDLDENEVNIGELKEEVLTLENALIDLRKELERERNEKEVHLIQVGAELAAKDEEIKRLRFEFSQGHMESLAESMTKDKDHVPRSEYIADEDQSDPVLGTEHQVDLASTMDVTASRSPPTKPYLPAPLLTKEQEYKIADVPNFSSRLQAALVDSIACQNCKGKYTAENLKQILSTIQKVDSKTRKTECSNSRLAIETFDPTDIPRCGELLKHALEHSKDCQNCLDNSTTSELQQILSRLQGTSLPLNLTPSSVPLPEYNLIETVSFAEQRSTDQIPPTILPEKSSVHTVLPLNPYVPQVDLSSNEMSLEYISENQIPPSVHTILPLNPYAPQVDLSSNEMSSKYISENQIPPVKQEAELPVLGLRSAITPQIQIPPDTSLNQNPPVSSVSEISNVTKPVNEIPPDTSVNQIPPVSPGYEISPVTSVNQNPPVSSVSEISNVTKPVNEIPPDTSVNKIPPDTSVNQIPPVSPGYEISPVTSANQISPVSSVSKIPPVSFVNEIPNVTSVNESPPVTSVNQNPPVSSVSEISNITSVNKIPPDTSANQIPPDTSVNEIPPDTSANQIPPVSSVKQIPPVTPYIQELELLDNIPSETTSSPFPPPDATSTPRMVVSQPPSDNISSERLQKDIPLGSSQHSSEEKLKISELERVGFMPLLKTEESSQPASLPKMEQLPSAVKIPVENPLPTPDKIPHDSGLSQLPVPSSVPKNMSGPATTPTSPQGISSSVPISSTSESLWTKNTLQLKCRVKDHFIKSLADQLIELSNQKAWSSNRLQGIICKDPVKTYDFDRVTLMEYIEGHPPQLLMDFQTEPQYSSTHVWNFKVLNSYGDDFLLVGWSPSPSNDVTGVQIFVNGEINQNILSQARDKALLHPVSLSEGQILVQLFSKHANEHIVEVGRLLYPL